MLALRVTFGLILMQKLNCVISIKLNMYIQNFIGRIMIFVVIEKQLANYSTFLGPLLFDFL